MSDKYLPGAVRKMEDRTPPQRNRLREEFTPAHGVSAGFIIPGGCAVLWELVSDRHYWSLEPEKSQKQMGPNPVLRDT